MPRLPQCEIPFKQFLSYTDKVPTYYLHIVLFGELEKYSLKVLKRNIIACQNFRLHRLYDFLGLCRDRKYKRSERIRKKIAQLQHQ